MLLSCCSFIEDPVCCFLAQCFFWQSKKKGKKKMKKEVWKTILQVIIAVLTAVGTTLGVTSCM